MEWLEGLGLLGLFIGTFLAATVVPFSSDLLYVGVLLTGISPWLVFLVGTLGNWLGSVSSYWLGYLGKWEWLEKWFKVKPETLEKQQKKIDKWGPILALACWVPFVGDLFAIALGFYKVNFVKCTIYMLIGKALRFAVWTWLYIEYGEKVLQMLV